MDIRLSQIATRVGAEHRGPDAEVRAVAPLESAGAGELAACLDRRRTGRLADCRAAGLLLPRRLADLATEFAGGVLLVEDGRLALALAIELLHPAPPLEPGIGPGAVVDPQARLGRGVRVESLAWVGPGAEVGDGCRIGAGAVVAPGAVLGQGCFLGERAVVAGCCRLGARVRIGPGSVLGSEGFGVLLSDGTPRRMPQVGRVVIEDGVSIGANCTIDRATLGETLIGAGAQIDDQVHVGHNAVIGRGAVLAAQVGLSGSVTIGDGALLGGQAGVADHVTIGAGAQVGAKSGVGADVPAGARVAGYPARPVGEWLRSVFADRRRRRDEKPKGQP